MTGTELRQRLAAILAADAAGYSRLMSLDERGTVAALEAARSVFQSQTAGNQGRVVDTAGDSVLAVFETAAGALNAALQIQAGLAEAGKDIPVEGRMLFRIGIHMGDVMEKSDGSVYGDGVNIAARLQALAEPGQITVSDAIHGAVRGKVVASFEDQGDQQVKNMDHPVRAWRVGGTAPALDKPAASRFKIDLSLPDKPSIAVLPFLNLSGDPEQEYFCDGISEDIITDLSRFKDLFVIARNSSFSYKGKSHDIRQVGSELGVRYVLEGSIRRASNRIRVTAQLIDALNGNHIWAEKYDRVLEDIFAVQEELTRGIVAAIAPQIDAFEVARLRKRRPSDLTAYELAIQARAMAIEGFAKADLALRDQALALAKQALALDSTNTLALLALAQTQWGHIFYGTAPQPASVWQEAMKAATKAAELDPGDCRAHAVKGAMLLFPVGGAIQWDDALAHLRRAYEINPNDSFVLIWNGFAEAVSGNPRLGIEYLTTLRRVNPNDPWTHHFHHTLSIAAFHAGDYEATIHWATLARHDAPETPVPHAYLARGYVGLGQIDRAKAAFADAQRVAPEMIASGLDGVFLARSSEIRRRGVTFLRIAAGLDDPSAADGLR